ncbi:MAG: TetR/AcrR family transcriptional regulator [Proteobacteria bacterium]|nr:TetR/AcrR family transcriptional regulator [Pseudomonadota bacterium]MBU4296299.1 TetR/AcrR family transcriptional regulator [Pseudomonadota bacterium]
MGTLQANARNTFSNLLLEKQGKIVSAAVNEFARQGYRKASINTIVRDASIAKESLYQYFGGFSINWVM